jgi:hypothetical protein
LQVHLAEVGTCDACLRSGRQRVNVGLALGVALPGAYLGFALLAGLPHPELAPPLEALLFGLAVVIRTSCPLRSLGGGRSARPSR